MLHHYIDNPVSFERTWLSRQETIDILEKLQDSNRTNRRLWGAEVFEFSEAVLQKWLWLSWLPDTSKHDNHEQDNDK